MQTHMHLTCHLPLKGLIHAVMPYPVLIHVSNVMPNTCWVWGLGLGSWVLGLGLGLGLGFYSQT